MPRVSVGQWALYGRAEPSSCIWPIAHEAQAQVQKILLEFISYSGDRVTKARDRVR